MSKIQRYGLATWGGEMAEDAKGDLVYIDEVKANYHPLLRDLRRFVDGCGDMPRDSFNDEMIKRIDELLKEEA